MAPHRLQTQSLPSLGAPTRQRPTLPAGAEARSVAAAGEHLVFRLQLAPSQNQGGAEAGGRRAGIYRQPIGAGADALELLAADGGGAVLLEPQSVSTAAGDVVILKRSLPAGAPSSSAEILFARPGTPALVAPGQEVAVSADGSIAAVLDAGEGLSVVHLAASTLEARALLSFSLDDAQQAPLPAVSDDGSTVFVSQGGALMAIDVAGGEAREVVGEQPGVVSYAIAAATADDVVVLVASSEGGRPSAELVRVAKGGRTSLWKAPLAQPRVAPVVIGDTVFAALTLEPFGSATYGPVALVALPLAGGAHAKVVELGSGPLRLRATGDELLVEGGDELLRFRLG